MQIVAEKSLVVLAKLNADAPETRFVPNQLDPNALCSFLVKCARECSWVSEQGDPCMDLWRWVGLITQGRG